jgi:hypothetical protein
MRLKWFFQAVSLLAAAILFVEVVEAHAGGKMQLASQDAGPFKLTVWTSPDPAQIGEVHVAAAVASAEDALPVLDAGVFIEMVPQSGPGARLSGEATTEDSVNQFLYEAIFDVDHEGFYQVTVTATGTDGRQGVVSFALEVGPAPPLLPGLIGIILVAVITAVAVWFYLRATAPKAEFEEADEFDTVAD